MDIDFPDDLMETTSNYNMMPKRECKYLARGKDEEFRKKIEPKNSDIRSSGIGQLLSIYKKNDGKEYYSSGTAVLYASCGRDHSIILTAAHNLIEVTHDSDGKQICKRADRRAFYLGR